MSQRLALAASTARPTRLDHQAAVHAVFAAQRVAVTAHEAMMRCSHGELVASSETWREAELEVTRCMLREQTMRRQAHGRPWLVAV